jgi:hypothetical protein
MTRPETPGYHWWMPKHSAVKTKKRSNISNQISNHGSLRLVRFEQAMVWFKKMVEADAQRQLSLCLSKIKSDSNLQFIYK